MILCFVIFSVFCGRIARGNDCGKPPKIKDGHLWNVTRNSRATTAYFTCNKGFTNTGTTKVNCLPSGTWEKARIKCVPKCPPPPQPANAVISHAPMPEEKRVKGSIVLYKCKQGYHHRGVMFVYCLGQKWTDVNFSCVPTSRCRRPKSPRHGNRIGNDFSIGQKVWFMCDDGFEIEGSVVLQCLKNRTWNRPVPICKVVDCGSLQDPLHGKKVRETKTTLGGKVEFACISRHFRLVGSKRRICLSTGEWNGTSVVCKASCNNPGIPKHGNRIGNNFRHGKTLSFRCPKTRKMIGPKTITCYDGNWTNKKPQCLLPFQVKDYSQCGVRNRVRRPRIVGGNPSTHGMWPWQVGVYRQDRNNGKHTFICGGALIDENWILTAAHCFMYIDPEEYVRRPHTSPPSIYKVTIGDSHRSRNEMSQHTFIVTKIVMHPDYQDDLKVNDIALVKVSSQVTLGKFVRKVCLPKKMKSSTYQDPVSPGRTGHVAGWGATQILKPGEQITHNPGKVSSLELLSSQFQIQDIRRCQNTTDYWFNQSLSFCAGSAERGVGLCRGDSGGPFVMKVRHDGVMRWVAVGLVSWGEGCGIQGYYTFFTKLDPYVEWINQQIRASIRTG
ncbi:mannan-binding lectin serine protease 1-like [Acropora palmata]|uniref:mannan-binding lectin serine protease 1-like n=1 Tax=Acropora palmata TaxID=6131 RepID=UPI003DA12541